MFDNLQIRLLGQEKLEAKLREKSAIAWEAVANKNLVEMFNRGKNPPGTPRKTGELIRGRRVQPIRASLARWSGEFGYIKDYGPHVEYGHRIVRGGRQVGYVPGQKYLFKNVEIQRPIYHQDLLKELRK